MSNKVYLPPDQHMKFKMNVTDDEMYWNNSKSKYEIYVIEIKYIIFCVCNNCFKYYYLINII